ncbi:MAG: DUF6584 family protein [Mycetocola sp.]
MSIERAQAMWRDGDTQSALIELKTTVRERPDAEEARRVLVDFYREIRHLDQAGRWAIAIDGWTTELEKDRLARLLAQSPKARANLKKFLTLQGEPDDSPELRDLMAGPVEEYMSRFAASAAAADDGTSDYFFDIMAVGWVMLFIAYLLGLVAVYVSAVFGIGDPNGFARAVGLVGASLTGLMLLAAAAGGLLDRRWKTAAGVGLLGMVITCVAVIALLQLVTS